MKLALPTADLLAELQTVARVASTRSAVQALSGVMIAAAADTKPELQATDMEVGLRVPLAAEVARPGSAVLPARLLLDVVRSLPGERLTLEFRAAEQDVELISGPSTFHLRTLRAEDFPIAAVALAARTASCCPLMRSWRRSRASPARRRGMRRVRC